MTLKHPFNVMRHDDWDAAPRMPQAIGAAIAAAFPATTTAAFTVAIGGVATTYSYAAILGYVAYSALTSAALRALAPKATAQNKGTLINAREAAAPQEYVYGQVRKGGVITFLEGSGGNNKYLHMILTLAGHEVEEIGSVYINDEVVSIDASGFVTGDRWKSKVRIYKHLGNQTSASTNFDNVSTNLAATLHTDTSATSSFVGQGIAYIYARFEYDQDVFGGGLPTITAVVKGKKVYDPRGATTGYSNNAALCVRDYLTSAYGLNDSTVDDTYFAAAANDCDDNITLSAGGTQKRYTIDGVVNSASAIGAALADMMEACNGTLFFSGGAWKLKAGVYEASVKSLTLDDFRSAITLPTRLSRRDNFNRVTGKFIYGGVYDESTNPSAGDWIETDFPAIESAAFLTEDNDIDNTLDISLAMVTNGDRAQRIAKQKLFRSREQMTVSAEFGLSAMGVEVGDIIDLTIARYGWSNKEFEVVNWRLVISETGGVRIAMTLRETSSAAFAWNAEETAVINNNTTLPDYVTVAAPTGLALTATTVLNDDGISIPAILATWTASANAFVSYYEIQYKRLGGEEDYGSIADAQDASEDWGSIAVAYTSDEDYGLTNEEILTPDAEYSSIFGSTTSYTIQPVLNGYDYAVRVRAVNGLNVRSPWATSQVASSGDTTPPNEPLSLAVSADYKQLAVEWINPADQDLAYIEIWRNTTNNLSTATMIGTIDGTRFVDAPLGNNVTRFYWVRAVDYSLNKSDYVGPQSATTLLVTPDDFNDAVNDLFSEAGAFGIEPVSSLPASGDFDGQLVLLLPDITIYRWDATTSSWSTDVYTGSSVEAGSITYTSFASGIEPVGVVDTLPTVSGYEGPQVVVLTTDGKLYRLVSGAWTAAVNTDDITGTIGENLFSDDLRPIERVAALPTTGLTQGRVVLLTTDNKLYRYTGSAWTAAVPATDLTGQIDGTQIADAAVTASKIGAAAVTTAKIETEAITEAKLGVDAVTAEKIAANAVTAAKIGAAAVTTAKIATSAVTANELGTNAVTAAKIADNAVTSAKIGAAAITTAKIATDAITTDLIAANAITATEISDNAITSAKIIAGSITSSKIAAGAVTANEIAAGAITTAKISAGAVTSAEIAADAITTDKIAAGAVTALEVAADAITTDKIAAGAVTAEEIAAGSITTAKISAGAVTAAEIAADAITTSKIAAGAVTASEIAADAVTTDKIAAGAVTAAEITAGAVTTAKIAAGAVTATEIAAGAVVAGKIAADAVTASEIAANAVTASEIAAGAITTAKIAAGAVTATEIAASAVSADKIAANAITATKIAADAVTADKIAANAVEADAIAANAITTGKIAAGAVNADQIAANAITSGKIFAGAITSDKVAADAIIADKIAAGAIITSKLAAGAVTADKMTVSELSAITSDLGTISVGSANIANAAITNAKIADLAVNTVKIAGNSVTIPQSASGAWGTTLTVNVPDATNSVLINAVVSNLGATNDTAYVELRLDGSVVQTIWYGVDQVFTGGTVFGAFSVPAAHIASLTSGNHTVSITSGGGGNTGSATVTITSMIVRK
jgi:hypothetical protein